MAMTGGTSKLVHTGYANGNESLPIKLYVYYKSSQSNTENKSTIYCGMYITSPSSGYDIGPWKEYVNGSYVGTTSNTFDGSFGNFAGTHWIVENKSFTVSHNSDGKGTATIYWKLNLYSSWGGFYNPSGYFNIDLPTIPRQAKLTKAPSSFASNGNPPTIEYSNPAGNNASKLEICIAGWNGQGAYVPYRNLEKTGTSYTFTADDMEALKNRAGKTLDIKFVIYTAIGGKDYWSDSDKVTFTMVEDDTTKPRVSMDVSLNNGSLPSTFDNKYIQGKSRLDISLEADGKYGADISSYYATIDGKTYNSDSIITDVITTSGKLDVFGYAKDSRGFTGEAKQQIEVIPYSKPLLVPLGSDTAIQCYRSDGNGVRVGKSTSVWIKVKMSFYSVEGDNSCVMEWRRKPVSDPWNDSVHQWTPLTTYSEYNALLEGVVFDTKTSYTVQIRAIDTIGEQDIKTFEIPTEDVALHLGKGGKKVAVGTYCTTSQPDETFYSEWEAIFDKDVVVGGNILIGENKTTLRDYILSIMNGG